MAIITSGPYLGYSGTVDGITYSQLKNGKTSAKKKNGPRKVPATASQVQMMSATRIYSQFVKSLREFVNVGYALEATLLLDNPYNAMIKQTRSSAFHDLEKSVSIDYSNILVSKGSLPLPKTYTVEMTETGLLYTWSTEIIDRLSHFSDQIMMLAYFPELQESHFLTSGRERRSGTDLLDLRGIEKGHLAEVYLSFVSNDRKAIANSVYVGQFNW